MKPYAEVCESGQIDRIRRAVLPVIEPAWGIRPETLRLVSRSYNTTFRVGAAAGPFALRVNIGSQHSREMIEAEVAFARHLSSAKTFRVPQAIATTTGDHAVEVEIPGFETPVCVVLYEWLPGPTVGEGGTPEILTALGVATRELHELGAAYPSAKPPFRVLIDAYYGDPYRLPGQDLDLGLFEECSRRVDELFARLADMPRIPMHADLHLYNLKFHGGRLSIFDFDDAVVSWPVMDPAITLWYLRRDPRGLELEPHFWKGLDATSSDFGVSAEEFETLVAARTVLLVNDIVGTTSAETKKEIPRFIRRCEALLRHYLKTGRYAPKEVP